LTLGNLIERIRATREQPGLVVITGGEPYRQAIGPLCTRLIEQGFYVQIETNGTMHQPDMPYTTYNAGRRGLTIVCSPKAPTIHHELVDQIDAYKYVASAEYISLQDGLPTKVLGTGTRIARPHAGFRGPIYLQPEDHQDPEINTKNMEAALASCFKYGYRLCLQTHKLLGLE